MTGRVNEDGWLPISQAKSGVEFIVFHRGEYRIVQLHHDRDTAIDAFLPPGTVVDPRVGRMWTATEWHPLPAAPRTQAQRSRGMNDNRGAPSDVFKKLQPALVDILRRMKASDTNQGGLAVMVALYFFTNAMAETGETSLGLTELFAVADPDAIHRSTP